MERYSFLLMGLFILLFIVTTTVVGRTWVVDDDWDGADFDNIEDAVAASADNDTIVVHDGSYNVSIIIQNSLTIIGNGSGRVSLYSDQYPYLKIEHSNVSISGLNMSGRYTFGLGIEGASGVLIESCKLKSASTRDSEKIIFRNCTIYDPLPYHTRFSIWNCSDSLVENSTMKQLRIYYSSNITVRNCVLPRVDDEYYLMQGLTLLRSDNITIETCSLFRVDVIDSPDILFVDVELEFGLKILIENITSFDTIIMINTTSGGYPITVLKDLNGTTFDLPSGQVIILNCTNVAFRLQEGHRSNPLFMQSCTNISIEGTTIDDLIWMTVIDSRTIKFRNLTLNGTTWVFVELTDCEGVEWTDCNFIGPGHHMVNSCKNVSYHGTVTKGSHIRFGETNRIKIRGTASEVAKMSSAFFIGCANLSMDHVKFDGGLDGVYVSHMDNFTIENCSFSNYVETGIHLNGIHGKSNTVAIVRNCTMSNNLDGLRIEDSTRVSVINTSFIGNGLRILGIYDGEQQQEYYNSHRIENCTVNGQPLRYLLNHSNIVVPTNTGQVILVNCSSIDLDGRNISEHNGGLHVIDCNSINISWFRITNQTIGIAALNTTNITIGNTIFLNNTIAIRMVWSNGRISNCEFFDNPRFAILYSRGRSYHGNEHNVGTTLIEDSNFVNNGNERYYTTTYQFQNHDNYLDAHWIGNYYHGLAGTFFSSDLGNGTIKDRTTPVVTGLIPFVESNSSIKLGDPHILGNDPWITSATPINLSISVGDHEYGMLFYKIGSEEWSEYRDNTTLQWNRSSNETIGNLTFYGFDLRGITNEHTYRFKFDDASPNVQIASDPNGTYVQFIRSDTELDLISDDGNGSGLDRVSFRIWTEGAWLDWTDHIGLFNITGNGTVHIEYYAVDRLNKTSNIQNGSFFIDNSAPTTKLSFKETFQPDLGLYSKEITLTANDEGSSVDSIMHRVWDGNWSQWLIYVGPFDLDEVGTYHIEYYAVDNLGNLARIKNETITIEAIGPGRSSEDEPTYPDDNYLTIASIALILWLSSLILIYARSFKKI